MYLFNFDALLDPEFFRVMFDEFGASYLWVSALIPPYQIGLSLGGLQLKVICLTVACGTWWLG